ncbi:MAG: prepilin-type N-terminal cleavage/methylation domain-containing protein [Synergistaceae bacterium]|nr:prepilin-type N-terminal cleavage/methylation domain-containing protein [Synergistaceae bacterium]
MSGSISKRSTKKRAFTLVELLIVVIIIGILAGMMLLSAGAATDAAKAARIISDIKTMRSVAVLYKADHGDWPVWIYATGHYSAIPPTLGLPSRYSDLTTEGDGYWIGAMKGKDGAAFSVAYVAELDTGVRKIMERRSSETSLYGGELSEMKTWTAEDIASSPYKAEHEALITIVSK